MSEELLNLYQTIRETPALTINFPERFGEGHITRLDTNMFSLSSWKMKFHKDTFVQGKVTEDMRLLFCLGDGVEWTTEQGLMRLDHNEGCFCRSDGSAEKMSYQSNIPLSFLSVSIPIDQFTSVVGNYIPDPEKTLGFLPGRSFTISPKLKEKLHDIGSLESIHNGFEMMRLEANLLESMSFCLQEVLCEPVRRLPLHKDDMKVILALKERIEEDPANISDIETLAHEYCMSVSKLTRSFRKVYGISLHAYVIESRIKKGAELLLHEEISIAEIAEVVGYKKAGNFSADFRKRFGVLPMQFRQRF